VVLAEPQVQHQSFDDVTSSPAFLDFWNRMLENVSPEGILRWAYEMFGDRISLACSFSGPTGMVLLDMTSRLEANPEVFYLDTGFLFPETHRLRDVAAERYGVDPIAYNPLLTPEEQAAEHGDTLWSRDADACCAIRKVEPNRRALQGKLAWITGLRRDQASTRKDVRVVSWDAKFGLVKINPLANWSQDEVWTYIAVNEVPYNELHDRGFPSIGCTNCTKAVAAGEDPRSGRWSGSAKVECGIHTAS
jgi:phosphoadenosine phosphosulfate reductase